MSCTTFFFFFLVKDHFEHLLKAVGLLPRSMYILKKHSFLFQRSTDPLSESSPLLSPLVDVSGGWEESMKISGAQLRNPGWS